MYGVGLVGAGWVASEHIKAFEANPDTRVVAICSSSRKSAEAKVKEMGITAEVCDSYDELLARPDVDIVSIATPNHLHFEEVMKASEAGKHMLIEKPASWSSWPR